jgi:hypothetical protein
MRNILNRDFITIALFLFVILLSACKWPVEETSRYEMEDATAKGEPKFLEYLGKGQFEKSQFSIVESGEKKR